MTHDARRMTFVRPTSINALRNTCVWRHASSSFFLKRFAQHMRHASGVMRHLFQFCHASQKQNLNFN